MELIYTANKPKKLRKELIADEKIVCSLSPKNLLAFSCVGELQDPSSGSEQRSNHPTRFGQSGYHVYLCDIDCPWDVTHIGRFSDPIVALQWHVSGSQLLVTSTSGACSLWQMKDYIINRWTNIQSVNLGGEEVITVGWLHQETYVSFNADKKDSNNYQEKIMKTNFEPSLSSYGGKLLNGWLAVTATGMVCVSLCKDPGEGGTGGEPQLFKASLMPSRSRVAVADIAYTSSGEIHVALSDGQLCSAIQSYSIKLKNQSGNPCLISSQVNAGFFAKCHLAPAFKDSPTARITHLKYMHSESSDILIVGAGDSHCSYVELWKLIPEKAELHRIFQSSLPSDSNFTMTHWVFQSSIAHSSPPSSIAVPRFPVHSTSSDPSSVLFQYVAVAYMDGLIKLVDKHRFQTMTTTNLDMGITDLSAPPEKRRKGLAFMAHMQQSFTGCVLVGLDQYGCLYAMKAVNTRDPVTQVAPAYLVSMLEFAVLTKHDWWDILSAIRPGAIESVIHHLTENLSQQLGTGRDVVSPALMAVKGYLMRCTASQQRAADCHCQMILHSMAQLFKSLLRPKAVSSQDMSPAERLTSTCNKSLETEIDKVLVSLNLENKEFVVESAALQNLQQLIQWVGDLCLYLLTSLPSMSQGYASFPGQGLLRDTHFLGLLREVLVIIRIWGLINPGCAPTFMTTSSTLDCLPLIFSLITRVWASSKESSTEFEESLVNDCCLLQSQVLLQPVDEGLLADMNYGSSIFNQPHPVQLTFGMVPNYVHKGMDRVMALLPEGQIISQQRKDIVRLVYMGHQPPSNCRKCSRCGCLSLHKTATMSPVLKAWELRFYKNCPCGGQWTLVTPKTAPAPSQASS